MEVDIPPLASILTLVGATFAAGLVTGTVEAAKRTVPRLVTGNEQALSLAVALAGVLLASWDRHLAASVTTPNDVFVSFVAWLAIARGASVIHDEATAAPGSFRGE